MALWLQTGEGDKEIPLLVQLQDQHLEKLCKVQLSLKGLRLLQGCVFILVNFRMYGPIPQRKF